jgi:DNA processing protein
MRRAWLLAELSGPLDFRARDGTRLLELLSLDDDSLLRALAGRRRTELQERHGGFRAEEATRDRGAESVCRHDPRFPRGLSGPTAPHMLHVAGGAGRLSQLAAAPVVAIVGCRRASDYGMEVAKDLARGLSASGVTVAGTMADGIAVAAHAGALETGAGSLAVMGGGLGVSPPARRRSLFHRVTRHGCAVSELPCDVDGRRWAPRASERIVAGLARLTVVVEATNAERELATARLARGFGRFVAAIPGRVTSMQSSGTNALLMEGAALVRGAQDVLDLLYLDAGQARPAKTSGASWQELPSRLRRTLAMVGSGCDTPEKLSREGAHPDDVLLSLSELELMGALARGDGGRYVPRSPSAPPPSA